MPQIQLTPAERKVYRADAHHLDPVVMIGGDGLSAAVIKETEAALNAHGLIKIRVLGDDRAAWAEHDATELVKAGRKVPPLLIDQGLADNFLAAQLHPHLFEAACQQAGQALTLRRHEGYDHGYYFIASFVEDHLRHHAQTLADL